MTDHSIQPQKRLIDVINGNTAAQHVSFEFFPPKTEVGDEKLKQVLLDLAKQNPVFVDFTWGAGGTTHDKTPKLCVMAKNMGLLVNMHLTCTNMDEGKVDEALIFCLKNGIRNIVALRGDPPAGQEWKASKDGFTCAHDLVKHIRKHFGDYFCIAVAGYPEGHPDKIHTETGKITEEQMQEEITYLKKKVDAGADIIITQLFYCNSHFFSFVEHCRAAGIKSVILPGMLPMQSYGGVNRMVSLCKTYVPPEVLAKVEELKEKGDEAFREFGVELTTRMVRELQANGHRHIHYYCLNQSYSVSKILKNLNQFID